MRIEKLGLHGLYVIQWYLALYFFYTTSDG